LKKKVAIIGTNGLPAKYGGFETLANYLVENLSKEYDLTVYCSKLVKNEKLTEYKGAKLKHFPLSANGMEGILYDIVTIIHAFFTSDTLLILGSSGTIILPLNYLFRKRIVFNFGGLDWQREKWNLFAKKFLKLSETLGVKFAEKTIVDNSVFGEYVKSEYGKDSYLIEYGGDHVIPSNNSVVLNKYNLGGKKYFLSVSRAQEDNNIHLLLEAFKLDRNKDLAIISNWNTSEYGRRLKEEYSNIDNIEIIDAVYNQNELDAIRSQAYCYIHTHSACGSAPSLIEAMSLGLPIISFDVEANRSTTENKAIYFKDVAELTKILSTLKDEELDILKSISKEIADRRYKWAIISKKYSELF